MSFTFSSVLRTAALRPAECRVDEPRHPGNVHPTNGKDRTKRCRTRVGEEAGVRVCASSHLPAQCDFRWFIQHQDLGLGATETTDSQGPIVT